MYKRILVPIDGSDASSRGLQEAIRLAGAVKAGLVVQHVVVDLPWLVEMSSAMNSARVRNDLVRYAEELLAKAKQQAAESGVDAETVVTETFSGRAADSICQAVQAKGCDLIVMGTHGRKGLGRLVLGSDAAAVIQDSQVPVLLVRPAAAGA
jgi:nucleotide-binding universal stress UspA family protein